MKTSRRSFLGSVLAVAGALVTRAQTAPTPLLPDAEATMKDLALDQPPASVRISPEKGALTSVHRTSEGLEYVCVPWSRNPNDRLATSFETRLLRPAGLPVSKSGYFVETADGLREVLKDDDASKLLADLSGIMADQTNKGAMVGYSEALKETRGSLPWRSSVFDEDYDS